MSRRQDFEGRAEDHLLEGADEATLRVPDEGIDVTLRRLKIPGPTAPPKGPTEEFFAALTSGKVSSAMYVCDHANTETNRLLIRARGAWLLGCETCVKLQLRIRGEDRRCDWCGRFTPSHLMPATKELAMRTITVVARFCPTHNAMIEAERAEARR